MDDALFEENGAIEVQPNVSWVGVELELVVSN